MNTALIVVQEWTAKKMKVVENENQVDKYGRNYIKFTGVKNLQEIQNWLFDHYQGYKFAMEFDCYSDECQEIGNEYWVYFLDDLAEEYPSYDDTRVFITHSCCEPEIVDLIKEKVAQEFKFKEIIETKAGSVVTSHCGQGTLGVLFITTK